MLMRETPFVFLAVLAFGCDPGSMPAENVGSTGSDVPTAANEVLGRCLAKDRSHRFDTAADAARAFADACRR